MIKKSNDMLYLKTMERLRRMQITDPTSAIIALAEEVEHYREKIQGLIEHYEAQAEAKKTEPVKPDYVAGPAVIELRPRCSKCGAPLENVAGKIVRSRTSYPGVKLSHQRVTPATCPNCGSYFEGIQQTVVPVEVE